MIVLAFFVFVNGLCESEMILFFLKNWKTARYLKILRIISAVYIKKISVQLNGKKISIEIEI